MSVALYDDFADYDRFVRWDRRLASELPFIERQLANAGAQRVLDAACGTGQHAIALAQRGYKVTGADLSAGMIERARRNAQRAQLTTVGTVRFVVAGFGELAAEAGTGYDAVLCLGNSLPHVLHGEALRATLEDWSAALRPGGIVLVQNRNYDAVMANRERWMPLLAYHEGDREWLFLRFYDFNADGTLTFSVITLQREGGEGWTQRVQETTLYPWRVEELVSALRAAGYDEVERYGDMGGWTYDPESSSNLVIVTRT